MPINQGWPTNFGIIASGTPVYPDSSFVPVQQGKQGEVLMGSLHGRYFASTYRGNVFIGSTAVAGTAIPVNTTVTATFMLWNPASSTKLLTPISYYAGMASGTGVPGAIGYQILSNTLGGATGTTAVITAFTDITPVCGRIGAATPLGRFAASATIVTTNNITFLRSVGLSQGTPITGTASFWSLSDTFDATIQIPPGYALYTVSNAAVAAVMMQSIVWEETPLY